MFWCKWFCYSLHIAFNSTFKKYVISGVQKWDKVACQQTLWDPENHTEKQE